MRDELARLCLLLSEVDAYAARKASGRPEAIRQLLDAGLDAAEELDARLTEIEVGRPGDDDPAV